MGRPRRFVPVGAAASHHHQSHLLFGNRLQVRDTEGVRESGSSGQGLGRLDGGGEAVQPRPLGGAPHGGAGLRRTASEVGRAGRAVQELVKVETYGERRQALHVGAVDELLAAHHMRLEKAETGGGGGRQRFYKKPKLKLKLYLNHLWAIKRA